MSFKSNARRARHLALCVLVVGASAFADVNYGTYYKSFGNDNMGAWVKAGVRIQRNGQRATGIARAFGKLQFMGDDVLGGSAEAKAFVNPSNSGASARLELAGNVIWSDELSSSINFDNGIELDVFHPEPTLVATIGIFPVTLSGNVGAGARLVGTLSVNVPTAAVGFAGEGGSWANGHAAFALGIPYYNVGLEVAAQFATLSVVGNVNASAQYGLSGNASVTRTPIVLLLKLVLNAWPFSTENVLASYSWPAEAQPLF